MIDDAIALRTHFTTTNPPTRQEKRLSNVLASPPHSISLHIVFCASQPCVGYPKRGSTLKHPPTGIRCVAEPSPAPGCLTRRVAFLPGAAHLFGMRSTPLHTPLHTPLRHVQRVPLYTPSISVDLGGRRSYCRERDATNIRYRIPLSQSNDRARAREATAELLKIKAEQSSLEVGCVCV